MMSDAQAGRFVAQATKSGVRPAASATLRSAPCSRSASRHSTVAATWPGTMPRAFGARAMKPPRTAARTWRAHRAAPALTAACSGVSPFASAWTGAPRFSSWRTQSGRSCAHA